VGELVERNYVDTFFKEPDDPRTLEHIEGVYV
jgi:ABC-type phosphate transport system ATPase subunit